VKTFTLHT